MSRRRTYVLPTYNSILKKNGNDTF